MSNLPPEVQAQVNKLMRDNIQLMDDLGDANSRHKQLFKALEGIAAIANDFDRTELDDPDIAKFYARMLLDDVIPSARAAIVTL